ncbi:TraB/GumN family protein [Fulvivirga lutea]|uniref:TraB/GumN family protein n=1 Tax=Fulvivirga lutea TaxID=2810512 RepID=A0A974WE47_9BACT|nr:TraB/GumN family protein [Fulvivirga lutea]QSE96583.1 TraB/GumN family protein [Fulvivirga lutea]
MKTRKLVLLVLALSCFFHTHAQKEANSLLWEVSGNGLDKPSYIFGILKFIPADDYYWPKKADDAFKSSQILSTETQLDHHARHELNKAAHLEGGNSLEDYLTEAEMEKLSGIFSDRFGISDFKFNVVYKKFKPIMLSTTMTRLSYGENVKYYELELINQANTLGITTQALEKVEKEVEALEKIKLDDQLKSLKHTLENFDAQLKDYEELVSFYKKGDLHKTLEYTMHPLENHEDYETHFIFGRNRSWIPKIEEYMKSGQTFFALGASHLSEEAGVLNLLRKKGYTVEPVQ